MKRKFQEIIDEHVRLIVRNIVMALIVGPFVIAYGFVFFIHLAKEGFSFTTIGALVLFLGILLVIFINFQSIAKDLKTIKDYKFLKENAEN